MKPSRCLTIATVAVTFFSLAAFAQHAALTNADIIKLVRADLSADIVLTTIESAKEVDFDLSTAGLVGLKESGVSDTIIHAMQSKVRAQTTTTGGDITSPERSERLEASKDPRDILRNFKTLYVDASKAQFFGNEQMKAALRGAKGFDGLGITIVEDAGVADVVLHVNYTFAWDYPFSLTHQNTTVVLLSGKGSGPLSGPKGATSVASELTKLLKPHRTAAMPPAVRKKP